MNDLVECIVNYYVGNFPFNKETGKAFEEMLTSLAIDLDITRKYRGRVYEHIYNYCQLVYIHKLQVTDEIVNGLCNNIIKITQGGIKCGKTY